MQNNSEMYDMRVEMYDMKVVIYNIKGVFQMIIVILQINLELSAARQIIKTTKQ